MELFWYGASAGAVVVALLMLLFMTIQDRMDYNRSEKPVKMADPSSFVHENPPPTTKPPESRPAPESIRKVIGK